MVTRSTARLVRCYRRPDDWLHIVLGQVSDADVVYLLTPVGGVDHQLPEGGTDVQEPLYFNLVSVPSTDEPCVRFPQVVVDLRDMLY